LSSTAAMYSAGVFTFSCPFIGVASSENSASTDRPRPVGPSIDALSHDGVGTFHQRARPREVAFPGKA